MEREEAERMTVLFAPAVYRMAYTRLGSRADAEDVTQETLLRMVRSAPAFDSDEHCKAWLLRVAANCANDLWRSAWRRRTEPMREDLEIAAPEPEGGGVLEAVLALPEKYRLPVHLFYYEGMTVAEIAKIIGKSESAVKSRLSRAREKLRLELEGGEGRV